MNPLARIIDASANRAREALRVLEDAARFAADDASLCARLKSLRHEVTAAIADLPFSRADLLHARDTEGDVGTGVSTSAEFARNGLPGVAAAAASRLTEALRSLEESAKAAGAPAAARRIEAARYAAYTLDKDLSLRLTRPRRQWTLCVLISQDLCPDRDWRRVAAAAIEGGADCLQLREKSLDARDLIARATILLDLARPAGTSVIINDRADVAAACGADGVHLGQTDLPVTAARAILPPRALIGVSTSSLEHARAARADGADYVGLGPMFPSSTKPRPTLAGTAYLRAFLADPDLAPIPHLAISGITPGNADELAAAGCRGIAVSSAVAASPDPAGVCRKLVRLIRGS